MNAIAPAKVILSGEHSVVYGAPALAVAVRRYAEVQILRASAAADHPLLPEPGQIRLHLQDLGVQRCLDLSSLGELKATLEARHQAYLRDALPIAAVLADPVDLYAYALALLAEQLESGFAPLMSDPLCLRLRSQIPLGAGMGSSAATVAALLQAVAGMLGQPLPADLLRRLCTQAEQLQHGRSSGLDPAVISQGGLLRFQNGHLQPLIGSLGGDWYLIDSGRPQVSTGEVVAAVRQGFAKSGIWRQFATTTEALAAALAAQDHSAMRAAVSLNQQLLTTIAVVPDRVQAFVQAAEALEAVVKVSGAGAHQGEAAGLLLWQGPDPSALCAEYGYQFSPLKEDLRGARFDSEGSGGEGSGSEGRDV